ncbi:Uncharacterised protein [Staphylococcus aureus]|nr:Uncharacterised protein [Staphylococcus aureus]
MFIICSVSSIVLQPITLGNVEPGTGMTNALEPVAKINLSYDTSIPFAVVTD